jgi:Rrf2 family nitric oxide-sensitive transcriptional repressor
MHLTRYSDIGLRLLMYLARERREVPAVTIAEVSNQFNVPHNHLVKVTGQLARQGWIDATRGRTGGVRLAVDPSLLKIGQVIRVLEGRKELIDCEQLECRLSGSCGLRYALNKSFEAFYAALDEFTLAEIIEGNTGEQITSMHKEFMTFYSKQSAK